MRKIIIILFSIILFSIIAFLIGFFFIKQYYYITNKENNLTIDERCRTRDGQYVKFKINITYENPDKRPEYHLRNAVDEASTTIVKLYNYNTFKNNSEEAKDIILEYVENTVQFKGFKINTFELKLEE